MDQYTVQLIDWWGLAGDLPWIFGLAVLLLTLSWGDWQAHARRRRRREMWGQANYQAAFSLGFCLFTLGLALNAYRWWEPYLWGAFTLLFAAQVVYYGRAWRHDGRKAPAPREGPRTNAGR